MSEALLEISGLSVRRDERLLLDDVSITVAPGTVHVIVGPNGAGKSTLVSAILGQTAFTGRVRFHWRASGRIGYVPQSFEVDRTLPITVAEFLALPRQRRPVCLGVSPRARRVAGELLERVGLADFGRRRLGVLSGGELRRVLFANAMDPAPEFLLCDEPASGLDPAAVARLDELVSALRKDGTTTLLVSHDVAQVRRLADRVTLLERTVKQVGSADEILAAMALPDFSAVGRA